MPYVLVDPLNIFEQQELMSALQLVTQAAQPVQLGWIRGLHSPEGWCSKGWR